MQGAGENPFVKLSRRDSAAVMSAIGYSPLRARDVVAEICDLSPSSAPVYL
jgi:hypothetical protein